MIAERIENPETIDHSAIEEILHSGRTATLQFSQSVYTDTLLNDVNQLCRAFGSRVEVRFYGHYAGEFDAAVLSALPDVRWLSVDCLTTIRNADSLWQLPALERLSFGVYEFDKPDFLSWIPAERLTHLLLGETRKRNMDLAPLGQCKSLRSLFLQGHTRHIDALGEATALGELRLGSIAAKQDLAFVKEIRALKSLELLLGSRTNFNGVSHPTLETLRLIRVRGLETLGELQRFPSLKQLHIEDQAKLGSISLADLQLREMVLFNCKTLCEIEGLAQQTELTSFRTSRTQLDLEALLDFPWPPAMETVALYSSREKWNKSARKKLDDLGYREFTELPVVKNL